MFYPRATRIISFVLAPVIVLAYAWLSISLARIDWRPWHLYDMAWMTGLGLLFAWTVWRLGSIRARVLEEGLEVRNVFTTRLFSWSDIVDAHLPGTSSWAVLGLKDGSTHAILAIQHSDGRRAHREIERLRTLIDIYTRKGSP